MERTKIVAFFREFPFLGNLLNEKQVGTARVSRVCQELMHEAPQKSIVAFGLFGPDIHAWSRFMILDQNGIVLTEVGIRFLSVEYRWYRPRTQVEKRVEETVGDAITRLGEKANQVRFVIELNPVIHDPGINDLVLHKPPKGFTIQGWVEEEIRRAQAVIRGEMAAIDTPTAS